MSSEMATSSDLTWGHNWLEQMKYYSFLSFLPRDKRQTPFQAAPAPGQHPQNSQAYQQRSALDTQSLQRLGMFGQSLAINLEIALVHDDRAGIHGRGHGG